MFIFLSLLESEYLRLRDKYTYDFKNSCSPMIKSCWYNLQFNSSRTIPAISAYYDINYENDIQKCTNEFLEARKDYQLGRRV